MLLPLLLLFTGVVRGQLPFHPKFLTSAGGLEDSPFLEAQRDALNLHEGDDASVAVAAPITINCTVRGTEFKATLLQKGAALLLRQLTATLRGLKSAACATGNGGCSATASTASNAAAGSIDSAVDGLSS